MQKNACILSGSSHVAGLLFVSDSEKQSDRCTYYWFSTKKTKQNCNWIIFRNLWFDCGILCPSQQNSWAGWWPPAAFLHSFTHTSHPTHSNCNHPEWSEHRGSVLRRAWLPSPTARLCPLPLALCKQVSCLACWHDKQSPHPAMALRVRVSPCLRWRTSVCVCANLCTCTCADGFYFKASVWRTGRWSCRVATDVRGFPFPFPPPSPHLSSKSVYPPTPKCHCALPLLKREGWCAYVERQPPSAAIH